MKKSFSLFKTFSVLMALFLSLCNICQDALLASDITLPSCIISPSTTPVDSMNARPVETYERFLLPNGVTLLFCPDSSAKKIRLQASLALRLDQHSSRETILAELASLMLPAGTKKRSGREAALLLAWLGARFETFFSKESITVSIELPHTEWRLGLRLLAEFITIPSFPVDEFKTAFKKVEKKYAQNSDGEAGTIFPPLTYEEVVSFYRSRIYPDNLTVTFSGNYDTSEIYEESRLQFGNLSGRFNNGKNSSDPSRRH